MRRGSCLLLVVEEDARFGGRLLGVASGGARSGRFGLAEGAVECCFGGRYARSPSSDHKTLCCSHDFKMRIISLTLEARDSRSQECDNCGYSVAGCWTGDRVDGSSFWRCRKMQSRLQVCMAREQPHNKLHVLPRLSTAMTVTVIEKTG